MAISDWHSVVDEINIFQKLTFNNEITTVIILETLKYNEQS